MKKLLISTIFTTLLITTGCAGKPKTPEEYRTYSTGSVLHKVETYKINKSLDFVKSKFEKYANKCLNKRIKNVSNTTGNMNSGYITFMDYIPSLKLSQDRLELSIYKKKTHPSYEEKMMKMFKIPKKESYIGVFDAEKIEKNKTKISIYRDKMGKKHMWDAIKGWADGSVNGCPNMAK